MNGHTDDEHPAPEWLDAAFVATSLGVVQDDVVDVKAKPAVAAGSNYCSVLWRVQADVGGERKHLMVKAMPRGEVMQEVVTNLGFFRRELNMYKSTLPAMRELGARRCGPGSVLGRPFTAKGLPCARPDTLVMEDLSAKGFRMQERREQLDLAHSKVALEGLSRLHALSVALYEEDPDFVKAYEETIFRRDHNKSHTSLSSTCYRVLADAIDTWEEVRGKGYSAKLRAVSDSAPLKLAECAEPRSDGRLNVLNHGDFWVNNFLFRYDKDDEVPVDVFLVDLQLCRYASPLLDVLYFINTSPQEKVRLHQTDELLEYYRQALNGHLTSLGLGDRALSREDVRRDYEELQFFGLHAAVCILCAVVAEPDEGLQMENLKADESTPKPSPLVKAVRGKAYRKLIPGVLDHFIDSGVL